MLAHEALEEGRVLRVDRDQLSAELEGRLTREPPATSDSLLARARRFPASSAASVCGRPATPTTAFMTMVSGMPANSVRASDPNSTRLPVERALERAAFVSGPPGGGYLGFGVSHGQTDQLRPGSSGTDSDNSKSEFVGDLEGLATHRPGGPQHDERLAHRRPMVRKYR